MESETKKKIAEALGYETYLATDYNDEHPQLCIRTESWALRPFNPETNDTQLWECVEKFEIDVCHFNYAPVTDKKEWVAFIDDSKLYRGDTPKAAVIAALNEMFGE